MSGVDDTCTLIMSVIKPRLCSPRSRYPSSIGKPSRSHNPAFSLSSSHPSRLNVSLATRTNGVPSSLLILSSAGAGAAPVRSFSWPTATVAKYPGEQRGSRAHARSSASARPGTEPPLNDPWRRVSERRLETGAISRISGHKQPLVCPLVEFLDGRRVVAAHDVPGRGHGEMRPEPNRAGAGMGASEGEGEGEGGGEEARRSKKRGRMHSKKPALIPRPPAPRGDQPPTPFHITFPTLTMPFSRASPCVPLLAPTPARHSSVHYRTRSWMARLALFAMTA